MGRQIGNGTRVSLCEMNKSIFPHVPGFGIVARTVSRYTQLTRRGRELHGNCPFCGEPQLCVFPARDDRAKRWDAQPRNEGWFCLGCGLHDRGNTAEAFTKLAQEYGLTAGEPREPITEPLRTVRWARSLPPQGSRPNLAAKWLGTPLSVEIERDGQGRLYGYRAVYERVGPMRWIYVRYSENFGEWKVRRPPLRERIATLFPQIPNEVAKKIQGRARVSVAELSAGENLSGYRAKAVAFALRGLGWIRKREGTGRRKHYYLAP